MRSAAVRSKALTTVSLRPSSRLTPLLRLSTSPARMARISILTLFNHVPWTSDPSLRGVFRKGPVFPTFLTMKSRLTDSELRQISPTFGPSSTCLNANAVCSSVNLLALIA
jgi:hypothetical protein